MKARPWFWPVVVASGVVLCAVLVVVWLRGGDPAGAANGAVAEVTRGELVVNVIETGTLEAERRKVIKNELNWPVIIKRVVPDGSIVEKDDVVIEFECKELIDAISERELSVTTARNNYDQVKATLEFREKETANNVRKAEQAVEDAQIDLVRYSHETEGEWLILKGDVESARDLAEGDLKLAKASLEFKKTANADPELNQPYSQSEIEADELSVKRLERALQKAEANLAMFITYDHPRQVRKLKNLVTDAELGLDNAMLQKKTELAKAQADVDARKIHKEKQEEIYAQLKEDEKGLVVRAPEKGLVVYDTGRRGRYGSDVVVEEGQGITPRQQLIIIPDMSTLVVRTKVYEAMIAQVRKGHASPGGIKAFIRLDAKPGMIIEGKVKTLAPIPDSQNEWLNPGVKIYNVTVSFEEQVDGLTPNMTAEVELVLERVESALQVPIAAVFSEQDKTYCWRMNGSAPQRVSVKVGRMNEKRVEIEAGLAEGDRVLLAPPISGEEGEEEEREPDAAPVAIPARAGGGGGT